MPVSPSGKRRPCKPLLQLVVVTLRDMYSVGRSFDANVTLPIFFEVAHPRGDTNWRAVWLGRHPAEKISVGPKDKLIQVGNLKKSAKAKAYLTVFCTAKNAEMKVGLSDPT
ncbi:hypothetical protein COU54_02735 [Candidatus Pacearchaeota archaeon CG10_big_fil_rev_8_21_14_0_10_31_24]|nr:MAG: hypothetical protein COU54_02735 [Candidatus Pacearchaeota archaeon CG10_big_fil_rev_8_21_14_0_10_31_24]